MAATGDEAAAMDSISREPAAVSAGLIAAASGTAAAERPDDPPEAPSSAPKKTGANSDGGVETAEEAVEPAEPDINELCSDMFEKMAMFLQGELTATCEDYLLLENMNKLTSLKYMEMKDISINISRNLQDLNNKYASLQPYLDQINKIEEQVSSLEQAAYKLDAYSKKLEYSPQSSPKGPRLCVVSFGRFSGVYMYVPGGTQAKYRRKKETKETGG